MCSVVDGSSFENHRVPIIRWSVECNCSLIRWLARDCRCPECRAQITEINTDRVLTNIVDNLGVLCYACDWEGTLGQFDAHEQTCKSLIKMQKTIESKKHRPSSIRTTVPVGPTEASSAMSPGHPALPFTSEFQSRSPGEAPDPKMSKYSNLNNHSSIPQAKLMRRRKEAVVRNKITLYPC